MEKILELVKAEKSSLLHIIENQKVIDNHISAAKYHEVAAMHHNEAAKQLEPGYYDRACGCSVKIKTNNLIDYYAQK